MQSRMIARMIEYYSPTVLKEALQALIGGDTLGSHPSLLPSIQEYKKKLPLTKEDLGGNSNYTDVVLLAAN